MLSCGKIKNFRQPVQNILCGGLTQIWALQCHSDKKFFWQRDRSDEDRAETFALHLRNIFQPNPATSSFVLPQIESESISLPPLFQPKEIAKVIGELKPKMAPGGDQITPKMLIELPNSAIEDICKLSNGIITLGYYPKKWKKSINIMIPKPGKDHTIPSSYRPISLLSCLSKLFEKCLLTRIIPYLFGFRQNHGTIEQVNRITSEIRTGLK